MRDIKKALAQEKTMAKCVIIGSSRILQISSERPNKSLSSQCPTIINLGVGGTSLEDYLALSENILKNENPPSTIIMSIDPWIFLLNRDKRWVRYKDDFLNMRNKIENSAPNELNKNLYYLPLISNLINQEYFTKSLKLLFNLNKKTIEQVPKFDLNIGLERAVLLPDGSFIYPKKYIKQSQESIKSGLVNYRIAAISDDKIKAGEWYQKEAINLFTDLIIYLKRKFNVIFVLVPYNPKVWEIENQKSVVAMKKIEDKTRKIARLLGVKVIGSFNPKKIGCSKKEFFDNNHPKDECLKKISG